MTKSTLASPAITHLGSTVKGRRTKVQSSADASTNHLNIWHITTIATDIQSYKTTKMKTTNETADQLAKLMAATVEVTGFSKETILSDKRFKEIAEVRMVFYYIAYRHTLATLDDIATFTGRTTSSVFSGIRKIHDYLRYDDICKKVNSIKNAYLKK